MSGKKEKEKRIEKRRCGIRRGERGKGISEKVRGKKKEVSERDERQKEKRKTRERGDNAVRSEKEKKR